MVFGFPASNTIYAILVIVFTLCFIISAVTGIDRGIYWLSNTNLALAGFLLVAVFIMGNPQFVLTSLTEGLGGMIQNFIGMSTWTNNLNDGAFVSGWTVFYWAWWIAWAPFVGGFIARISKGRTIREFVMGVLIVPQVICATWMCVWGGNALYMQHTGAFDFKEMFDASVASPIFGLLQQWPAWIFFSICVMLVITIFFITSADSATFTVSMYCSYGNENPKTWLRVLLGSFEGGLALILLITGGLAALQTASIVGSLPFMIFMVMMFVSIGKAFNKEVAEKEQEALNEGVKKYLAGKTIDETLTTEPIDA